MKLLWMLAATLPIMGLACCTTRDGSKPSAASHSEKTEPAKTAATLPSHGAETSQSAPIAFNAAGGGTFGCWCFYIPNGNHLFTIAFPEGRGRRLQGGGMSLSDLNIHGPFEIEFDSVFHKVVYNAERHHVSVDDNNYDLNNGTVIFMQPNPTSPSTPRMEQIAVPIDQAAFCKPQPQGNAEYVGEQLQRYLPAHAIPVCNAPANIAVEIERLASPNRADCTAAVESLVKIGKPAVPALIETLGFSQDDVRARAAEAIRKILAADPTAAPNAHTKEYWEKRIATLKPDTSVDDAVVFLLPDLSTAIRQQMLAIQAKLRTDAVRQFTLDDYWRITVFVHGPSNDKLSNRAPMIFPEVKSIAAIPPDGYTGNWTQWYVNGQKRNTVEYVNGVQQGGTDYTPDGIKTRESTFDPSTQTPTMTEFYPSGRKASETRYDNKGNLIVWKKLYEDGKPPSTFFFKDGKPDGIYTRWYANGQKNEEKHYTAGVLDGLDSHWDEQDKLLWTHTYKDGKLIDGN